MFSLRGLQRIWGHFQWECHMPPHSLQICIKGLINLTSFSLVRRRQGKPISCLLYADCKKAYLPKKNRSNQMFSKSSSAAILSFTVTAYFIFSSSSN